MKNFLAITLLLWSQIVFGQSEPITSLQGDQGTKFTSPKLVVPNLQATKTAKGGRIETGNNNLLANPSFEHSTYNTGWTCSLGSTTLETTAKTDGNQANAINSIGAGVRCYQTSTTNAANLKGLLGSAIVKIKTTDSIYKVCGLVDGNAAANERNCITVSPTSTDLPFYPARTDFYMGGTSNGIVIYTTTTTSQPTVIDDALVGVFNGGLSQFSNNYGRRAYSPSLTGFGTGAVSNCFESRENQYLNIDCTISIGTSPSASEARLPLPSGLISTSSGGALAVVGSHYRSQNSPDKGGAVFRELSQAYLTFGPVETYGANTAISTQKVNYNSAWVAGNTVLIVARVPIAGWEANTNAAIAGCVDAFGCENTFSAKVSSSGVISGENIPGWLSSCTYSSGSVCVFRSNLFTSVPNCWIGNFTTGSSQSAVNGGQVYNVSTAGATFASIDAAGTGFTAKNQTVYCQKTGADFKPKTVVVSPLQGYLKVPGAENLNVETFSVSYGTTNATTVCSASPCSYLDQIGSGISSITRSGAGIYALVAAKTYIKLKCTATVGITSSSVAAIHPNTPLTCTSCSSLNFQTTDGSIKDSFGTLVCQGTY